MRNKSLWITCCLALVLSVMFTPKVSATEQDPPYGNQKEGNCNDNCLNPTTVTIYCFSGSQYCVQTPCIQGTCGVN